MSGVLWLGMPSSSQRRLAGRKSMVASSQMESLEIFQIASCAELAFMRALGVPFDQIVEICERHQRH
jgi:hypothetical protein